MVGTDTPLVSIIVVSFNTCEMTLECLRSVVAETRLPYELLVMDNASSDGSAEAIAAEFPDIRFWAESDNHGFAKANNILAREARGDFVLLLNPDTVVLDGAIDRLVEFSAAQPAAKIWGGRTVFKDGSLNPYSVWRKMDLWSVFCRTAGLTGLFPNSAVFNSEAYGGWDRADASEVDVVVGCFFLMKRSFWEELDGFDLSFFMYGEEADLCLRARRRGARPMMTPDATIIHYGAASETVRSDKMVRILKAKITLIDRHFSKWQKPLARGLFTLWPLSRLVASRAAALIGRGNKERSASWAEVWARRGEWTTGYPVVDTSKGS